MSAGLWAHALALAAGERRTRGAVLARFTAALAPADPLHSLYTTLQQRAPPLLAVSAKHYSLSSLVTPPSLSLPPSLSSLYSRLSTPLSFSLHYFLPH